MSPPLVTPRSRQARGCGGLQVGLRRAHCSPATPLAALCAQPRLGPSGGRYYFPPLHCSCEPAAAAPPRTAEEHLLEAWAAPPQAQAPRLLLWRCSHLPATRLDRRAAACLTAALEQRRPPGSAAAAAALDSPPPQGVHPHCRHHRHRQRQCSTSCAPALRRGGASCCGAPYGTRASVTTSLHRGGAVHRHGLWRTLSRAAMQCSKRASRAGQEWW